jgi:hypothetical protein
MEDWYKIQPQEVYDRGGNTLLKDYYNENLGKLLAAVYPEYVWEHFKFIESSIPHGYWWNTNTHRQFFDWMEEKLNVRDHEDWYEVKVRQIKEHGGSGVLKYYNDSLAKALREIYPGTSCFFSLDSKMFKNIRGSHGSS